jgi:hypothetical protein
MKMRFEEGATMLEKYPDGKIYLLPLGEPAAGAGPALLAEFTAAFYHGAEARGTAAARMRLHRFGCESLWERL